MNTIFKKDRAAWLQGPSAKCSAVPGEHKHPWRLILLGAPGVGKGTQAELLTGRLDACHLSTGDLFRAAGEQRECDQSPAMKAALEYMRRGELVPDSTVWEMVRERIGCILDCGFILDGFPRTLGQAESLKELMEKEKLSLSAVVNYELPLDEIVRRLRDRRRSRLCAIAAAGGSISAKMTGPSPSPCVWKHTNEAPRHSSSSTKISAC